MRFFLFGLTSWLLVSGFDAAGQGKPLAPLRLDDRPFSESLPDLEHNKPITAAPQKEKPQSLAAKQRKAQYDENAAFWRGQIEKSPGTAHYYRRLLYTLRVLGRCDEIPDVANRLLEIEPIDTYALSALGGCL